MFNRAVAGCVALCCIVGCSTTNESPSESATVLGPSMVSTVPADGSRGPAAPGNLSTDVIVNMHDACDPTTFNAAIRPGACVRNGGVKFDDFISQLTRLGFVGSWHFAPKNVNAKTGEQFLVVNRGGEVHTFTEVEEFGGGIVPDLNERAHLPKIAPECQSLESDDFVAPGATYEEDIEEAGNEKYQCCIHPWMRLEVHVSAAH